MQSLLTYWFWGALTRAVEALLAAAPTYLCGLLVVGILRHLLGQAGTRRLFGNASWRALPQAWALGMLLPVCSLGVIPVARELRRAGISGGVLLAFALAAPLFNPLSVMYGLTLSKPLAIFGFAAGSLVVLTVVGSLWDRLCPGSGRAEDEPPPARHGIRRMLAIGATICRTAVGPAAGYLLVGLAGVGLLGAWLPYGSLQTALHANDPTAPLTMLGVGLPAYAPPMTVMMQIGSMFHHGNSVGAAFVLLTIGAGTNLGLLVWVVSQFGLARTAIWLALVVSVVLSLAYGLERPLADISAVNLDHVEAHPHTHAFDMYCQPFPAELAVDGPLVARHLGDQLRPHELGALATLGLLMLGGWGLRLAERRWNLEAWFAEPPTGEAASPGIWSRPLPASTLGAVALLVIVAASIMACYVYYPRADVTLEDLTLAKVELLSAALTGDAETAEEGIDRANDLTRRLEVGVYLRQFRLSDECRRSSKTIRDLLEVLDHSLEDGADGEEIRRLITQIDRAFTACRAAYQATSEG